MMRTIREIEPVVAETFTEADRIMTPLLGNRSANLSSSIQTDASAVAEAEEICDRPRSPSRP